MDKSTQKTTSQEGSFDEFREVTKNATQTLTFLADLKLDLEENFDDFLRLAYNTGRAWGFEI